MKMADMIHLNYLLLSVVNRFGMNLGFGDDTIEEQCKKHNINTEFFLEIVNTFNDKNYFPQKRMQSFSVMDIIGYLQKTHKFYLELKLPYIESMISELIAQNQGHEKNLSLLVHFFKEYERELINHIEREEKVVYPYIKEIEKALDAKLKDKILFDKMNAYPIDKYEGEHDNVEEKLFDLKNIIIKYLPPLENSNMLNRVLNELFKLEKDLNDHSRIEDKVLVPKVSQMEENFRKLFV